MDAHWGASGLVIGLPLRYAKNGACPRLRKITLLLCRALLRKRPYMSEA